MLLFFRNVETSKKFIAAIEKNVQIIRGIDAFNLLIKKLDIKENTSVIVHKANPYAKASSLSNPYTKVPSNPYAKKASNPYSSSSSSLKKSDSKPMKNMDTTGMLWADAHAPTSTRDILGNGDAVSKLTRWLSTWEQAHLHGKNSSTPRAALLSGPPGIGERLLTY